MKSRAILISIALALALVTSAVHGTALPSTLVPLLEVHSSVAVVPPGPPGPLLFTAETITIFRDATTLLVRVKNQLPSAGPFQGEFRQGMATPGVFAALTRAISAARIGVQRGGCIGSFFGGIHTYQVTWFGQRDRMNTFTIASSFFPTPCPPELGAIFDAIRDYKLAVFPSGE